MVYKVRISCNPWFSPHQADEKVWVTFEWTDAPNISWKPEDKRSIDHRLIVKFYAQNLGLFKQWNDVTRVNFVKVDGSYKMELYDSKEEQLQHLYLHSKTFSNNDKLTFRKKDIVDSENEWRICMHWDFTDNQNGTYTASMQHLPHAVWNTKLKNANPYFC